MTIKGFSLESFLIEQASSAIKKNITDLVVNFGLKTLKDKKLISKAIKTNMTFADLVVTSPENSKSIFKKLVRLLHANFLQRLTFLKDSSAYLYPFMDTDILIFPSTFTLSFNVVRSPLLMRYLRRLDRVLHLEMLTGLEIRVSDKMLTVEDKELIIEHWGLTDREATSVLSAHHSLIQVSITVQIDSRHTHLYLNKLFLYTSNLFNVFKSLHKFAVFKDINIVKRRSSLNGLRSSN